MIFGGPNDLPISDDETLELPMERYSGRYLSATRSARVRSPAPSSRLKTGH